MMIRNGRCCLGMFAFTVWIALAPTGCVSPSAGVPRERHAAACLQPTTAPSSAEASKPVGKTACVRTRAFNLQQVGKDGFEPQGGSSPRILLEVKEGKSCSMIVGERGDISDDVRTPTLKSDIQIKVVDDGGYPVLVGIDYFEDQLDGGPAATFKGDWVVQTPHDSAAMLSQDGKYLLCVSWDETGSER